MAFIFGGDTPWTYEELQRKRGIADQLRRANAGTPSNVGEGLAAIGRALAARSLDKRAGAREGEIRAGLPSGVGMPVTPDDIANLRKLGVPGFYRGTNYAPGGLAVVGERGPELVNLPEGAQVAPNGAQPPNQFVPGAEFDVAQAAQVPEGMLPKVHLELDKKYIPEYLDWTVGGGSADARKSVSQMREALGLLKSGKDNLTGPVVGATPDFISAMFNPEAVSTREAVQEIVQRNLRLVLGAQFTENEGAELMARAFNPSLQEGENAKRVGRLLDAIESAAEARDSAARYFQSKGTLAGWDGNLPTMADLETVVNGEETPEDQDAAFLKELGLE